MHSSNTACSNLQPGISVVSEGTTPSYSFPLTTVSYTSSCGSVSLRFRVPGVSGGLDLPPWGLGSLPTPPSGTEFQGLNFPDPGRSAWHCSEMKIMSVSFYFQPVYFIGMGGVYRKSLLFYPFQNFLPVSVLSSVVTWH